MNTLKAIVLEVERQAVDNTSTLDMFQTTKQRLNSRFETGRKQNEATTSFEATKHDRTADFQYQRDIILFEISELNLLTISTIDEYIFENLVNLDYIETEHCLLFLQHKHSRE